MGAFGNSGTLLPNIIISFVDSSYKVIRWIYWNVVWEELYDYVVIQKKLIKFTKIDKLRIKLIKLLKPVSFLIYSYYIKKNLLKQKHK